MKRHLKKTCACLAFAALGGMLAGFTPASLPVPAEWRGKFVSDPKDARLPLRDALHGGSVASVSGRFQPEPTVADAGAAASGEGWLHLGGRSVSILTADGPRPVPSAARWRMSAQTFLSPLAAVGDGELFSSLLEAAALSGGGEILDADGRPLRWAELDGREFCRVIPSLSGRILAQKPRGSQARYQGAVERYAAKYQLDAALVLAIMKTESGFDPTLISGRDAHGLMQVVPHTAGGEVHRWIGREGQPSPEELLNPDNNIRYGTTYLHLLRTRHFEGVENPQSLDYCVIAAYNGGSGAVLRLFGSSREAAVAAINAMTPDEVLASLTEKFPARETRAFLHKVLAARGQFLAAR